MQTSVAPAAFSPHIPETLDQVRVLETMGLIVVDVARLGSAQLVLGDFSLSLPVITYTFYPQTSAAASLIVLPRWPWPLVRRTLWRLDQLKASPIWQRRDAPHPEYLHYLTKYFRFS